MAQEMITMFEGFPLFSYVIDEGDSACYTIGAKRIPVMFKDPDKCCLDEKMLDVNPLGASTKLQAVIIQDLRRKIEAKGGANGGIRVAHLLYKKRGTKQPLFAVIVADRELTFEVTKKVGQVVRMKAKE